MDGFRLIEKVSSELVSACDMRRLDLVLSVRANLERGQMLIDMVVELVKGSNLRFYKNEYYCFTGKVYDSIGYSLTANIIREVLIKLHVTPSDRYMFDKRVVSKCCEMIRMRELHPKYSVLCFRNCILDVETNIIHEFSPEFEVVHLLDYDYHKEARCPQWIEFLNQVLPESGCRLILQEYFGLGFVNRQDASNKIENVLMLYGEGSNGKSVILNTIQGVLGRDMVGNCPLMSLIKDSSDERYRTMAMIDGKRFNMCTEIQAKDISKYSDSFKQLVSGEPQVGRFLKHDPYLVFNVPYLVFNANRMPSCDDMSFGFMRRFIIVPFNRVFTKEEQNTSLEYELKREYAGIMNWMLAGMRRLKKNGYRFSSSEAVENAVRSYLESNSNAFDFMGDYGYRYVSATTDEEPALIPMQVLYGKYVNWCDKNGEEAYSMKKFSMDLCANYEELRKKPGVRKFRKQRLTTGVVVYVYGVQMDKLRKDRLFKGERLENVNSTKRSGWKEEVDAAGVPYDGNEDLLD